MYQLVCVSRDVFLGRGGSNGDTRTTDYGGSGGVMRRGDDGPRGIKEMTEERVFVFDLRKGVYEFWKDGPIGKCLLGRGMCVCLCRYV